MRSGAGVSSPSAGSSPTSATAYAPASKAPLGDKDALKEVIQSGWNQFHLIARGPVIAQILNGRVTSALIDDDLKNRAMAGLIGIQLHRGDPMKIEVRNVYLKRQ